MYTDMRPICGEGGGRALEIAPHRIAQSLAVFAFQYARAWTEWMLWLYLSTYRAFTFTASLPALTTS
jgi:hypothetical protein